jgi:hypothetical protein
MTYPTSTAGSTATMALDETNRKLVDAMQRLNNIQAQGGEVGGVQAEIRALQETLVRQGAEPRPVAIDLKALRDYTTSSIQFPSVAPVKPWPEPEAKPEPVPFTDQLGELPSIPGAFTAAFDSGASQLSSAGSSFGDNAASGLMGSAGAWGSEAGGAFAAVARGALSNISVNVNANVTGGAKADTGHVGTAGGD